MHSAHIVGGQEEEEVYGHLWQFGNCEFDEFSRELRVNGRPVEMEAKPLEVLYQLLLHPGEVVTKEELLESVWSGVRVVDGSLATAVSKLRKTIGDDPPIVLTIPRVGYRLGVPARRSRVTTPAPPESRLKPGDPVPGRDQWQLLRNLDPSSSSDVWLAEHPKTRETRVFKFASDGIRLRSLKREVTLARLLKDSLGERSDFVRILEWNFDAPPFTLKANTVGSTSPNGRRARAVLSGSLSKPGCGCFWKPRRP